MISILKSKNISEIVLSESSEIVAYLKENKPSSVLILKRRLSINSTYLNYNTQNSYCNFPEWITKFDFNEWVSRAKIWRIKELVRKE